MNDYFTSIELLSEMSKGVYKSTLYKIYKLTVDDENVLYVYNYDIDYDV